MRLRRVAAGVAFAWLVADSLTRSTPGEIRGRVAVLRRLAGTDLRTRRSAGTANGFDRRFFPFVEAVRASLPPGARGVALYAPGIPEWGGLYLAVYSFAPLPVEIAPARPPRDWAGAFYGIEPPPGWTDRRSLPGGFLAAPP